MIGTPSYLVTKPKQEAAYAKYHGKNKAQNHEV